MRQSRIIKVALLLLVAVFAPPANAQSTTLGKSPGLGFRKFFIEPSSSSLAGGRARLTVGTLSRQGGALIGSYQIKVTPYFFKNEKGRLSIMLSEPSLRKLLQGIPAEFTGEAKTDRTNKTRPITASATPSTKDRGALVISVATENGKLLFETSYRIGD